MNLLYFAPAREPLVVMALARIILGPGGFWRPLRQRGANRRPVTRATW